MQVTGWKDNAPGPPWTVTRSTQNVIYTNCKDGIQCTPSIPTVLFTPHIPTIGKTAETVQRRRNACTHQTSLHPKSPKAREACPPTSPTQPQKSEGQRTMPTHLTSPPQQLTGQTGTATTLIMQRGHDAAMAELAGSDAVFTRAVSEGQDPLLVLLSGCSLSGCSASAPSLPQPQPRGARYPTRGAAWWLIR